MNRPVQLWAVQVAAPACREVVELEAHEDPQGIVARSRASEAVAKSLIRSGAVFIDDISAETALLAQLPASREPSKNALQAKLNGGFFAVQIKGNIQTYGLLLSLLHLHTPHHTPPWQALHLGRRLAGANCPTQEA
jgi:hypothetical protein